MRRRDLQPWLDYFEMLQTYEQKGFLEVLPDKGEAFITQPALFSMCSHLADAGGDVYDILRQVMDITRVLRCIRAYAGYRSQEGAAYIDKPFALHIVQDEHPHDLIYTLLVTQRRRWWWPWRKADCHEVIDYKE